MRVRIGPLIATETGFGSLTGAGLGSLTNPGAGRHITTDAGLSLEVVGAGGLDRSTVLAGTVRSGPQRMSPSTDGAAVLASGSGTSAGSPSAPAIRSIRGGAVLASVLTSSASVTLTGMTASVISAASAAGDRSTAAIASLTSLAREK